MKALLKLYPEKGIWMEEVPIPEPGMGEVLIKIKKTSICGTDVHIYEWNDWAQKTIPVPMVIGHEYVGTVVAVGSGVHSIKEGDVVTGEGHLACGVCRNCLAGRSHLCHETIGVGVTCPGAFAEYLKLPSANVWKTDKRIPEELYSIFDPLGNAIHTALSYDLVGEDVIVTGAGPIGIMAAAVAKNVGARNVAITDLNPYRLNLAKQLGIEHAYNVKEITMADIQKVFDMKEGFDVGLEMSGSGQAFAEMVDNMMNGGCIAVLGLQAPNTLIDWDKVVMNGLTIKGIYGRKMFETWYKMSTLLTSGLDISSIITHRFHIDEYRKGFDIMASGNSGKIILDWEEKT